jgi:medium-chain acyl-[acyl-carrier-protein] hydrolase
LKTLKVAPELETAEGPGVSTPPQRNPWVTLVPGSGPRRLRLFCLPYGGGGTAHYRQLARAMPPGTELALVQLPGREARLGEPGHPRIAQLLPSLAEGLRPFLDAPYAFFGHSMGALLSFELARHFRRLGLPGPRHIFASGHRGPSEPYPRPHIHHLPDRDFVTQLAKLGGIPQEVLANQPLLDLFLPVLRADIELCETYTYTPDAPLPMGITAFGGLEDEDVPPAKIEAWRKETTGPFEVQLFGGNHFFIHSHRDEVAKALSAKVATLT